MKTRKILIGILSIVALVIVGCENSSEVLNPVKSENSIISNSSIDLSKTSDLYLSSPGAVYAMTNSAQGNEIVAFERSTDGTLELVDRYSSKGIGSGGNIDPLGSQGSLILSSPVKIPPASENRWLIAVNAGSDQVSSFAVQGGRVELRDVVASGGGFPVSIAMHGNLLYVLNSKEADSDKEIVKRTGGNITGFHISNDGRLKQIRGSTLPLSATEDVSPAKIQFSPDGNFVVVTEKNKNAIDVYKINSDGLAEGPIVYNSVGKTPFGFSFDHRGRLLVAETFDGVPNASTVSLYGLNENGGIRILDPSVSSLQTGGGRTVVTKDGKLAFVSNTKSNTITAFEILDDGIKLIHDSGIAAETGINSLPTDLALSQDSHFLYVLNAGRGTIGVYLVEVNGDLRPLIDSSGLSGYLPAYAGIQGLAAY